jgi:DNA-binding winged helix-turn-helix (wHTH) protein
MMIETKQIFGAVMPSDVVAFGHFRLRAAERLLEKDGVRLRLGSRALDILIALTERAPEVVSKRELLTKVWPNLVVDEGSLRFHISVLRKVLGDGESGARYVANVAGRGYCFTAPISRSEAEPPSAENLRAERVAVLPHQTHNAAAIGALAGEVAQHFDNILGAILGYGELAQNAASADTPIRRYVDNIMIAGRRAKSLAERLLAFTRTGLEQSDRGFESHPLSGGPQEELSAAGKPPTDAPGGWPQVRIDPAG